MRIGILALQGDFEAHRKALLEAAAGGPVEVSEVRTAAELGRASGLVIPGGESTTMLKLIEIEGLMEPLREFGRRKPVFGTCAGAILLASEVTAPAQASLALMDIAVERNAYGRQVHSAVSRARLEGGAEIEAVFIRAPVIRRTGPGVTTLARRNGDPVLVSEGRHLAATFHPELSADRTVHRMFLDRVRQCASG
jgi:5'-phosphate synthase pdxT subunit